MKAVNIFNKILDIVSIFVFVTITIVTTYFLIVYFGVAGNKHGMLIAIIYVFNTINCIILVLLNFVGVLVLIVYKGFSLDNKEFKFFKKLILRLILIAIPIITYIIQVKLIQHL